MIEIHGKTVILHTMGKQVNELSEGLSDRFASFDTSHECSEVSKNKNERRIP